MIGGGVGRKKGWRGTGELGELVEDKTCPKWTQLAPPSWGSWGGKSRPDSPTHLARRLSLFNCPSGWMANGGFGDFHMDRGEEAAGTGV